MKGFNVIFIFILLFIKADAQGDWMRLGDVKKGDYILVVLEETELAKKANFGTWVPMALFQASRDGPAEWELSRCVHENNKMRITFSVKYVDSVNELKSVQYEWFNYGESKVDVSRDLVKSGSAFYNIPQYILKDGPGGIRILSVIHESSLELLKAKTSISKAAVFWDWNDLEITKL